MKVSFNQSLAQMSSDLPNTKTFLLTFRTYEISNKQFKGEDLGNSPFISRWFLQNRFCAYFSSVQLALTRGDVY